MTEFELFLSFWNGGDYQLQLFLLSFVVQASPIWREPAIKFLELVKETTTNLLESLQTQPLRSTAIILHTLSKPNKSTKQIQSRKNLRIRVWRIPEFVLPSVTLAASVTIGPLRKPHLLFQALTNPIETTLTIHPLPPATSEKDYEEAYKMGYRGKPSLERLELWAIL
jgi:hypothetical protein